MWSLNFGEPTFRHGIHPGEYKAVTRSLAIAVSPGPWRSDRFG